MKIIAKGVMCLGIAIAFGYDFFSRPQWEKKIIEAWETTNNTFKVSVTAYAQENGGFVGGAYYVFRSSAVDSTDWREIMTFRHDDPVAIPREQVHFVNKKIGYVFMGWQYGITIDSGFTWLVWSAEKDLPGWQCCNYKLIQDVRIAPDGSGTMRLNPIPQRSGEVPELHTKDYGRHWSVE
ncbi:MAG: hypothetical protein ACJ741_17020 [Pyrinomonadaceae bacterium]|jgi:hypothetical protein